MERNPNPNNLPAELNRTSCTGSAVCLVTGVLMSSYFNRIIQSGKNPHSQTDEFPIACLMEGRLYLGSHAGPRESFPSGWSLQQEEWLYCSLWVCFSTALTQVLALPEPRLR